MKLKFNLVSYSAIICSILAVTSCGYHEDPGPLQEVHENYSIVDFDRLEMGDGFNIAVAQGNFFEVSVRGDRRNVNDLIVKKDGSTLVIRYDDYRSRKHNTYITITMPALLSANFSGGSDSRITGFEQNENLDLMISGASVCQLDAQVAALKVVISGASYVNARGSGGYLDAEMSGASVLNSFGFPVAEADIVLSGASSGNVAVSDRLDVLASGASVLAYRGNPEVISDVSGSSTVARTEVFADIITALQEVSAI